MKVLVYTSAGPAVVETSRVNGHPPDPLLVYVTGPSQPIEEDPSPLPPGASAEVFNLSPSEDASGVEAVYRPAVGVTPDEAQTTGSVVRY